MSEQTEFHAMVVDGGNPRRTMAGPPVEGWRTANAQTELKGVEVTNIEAPETEHVVTKSSVDAMYAIKDAGSDHYKTGGVEPWDLIHSAKLNFDEGNIIKYVSRHRRKDGINDLKKAMTYLKALAYHEYGVEL